MCVGNERLHGLAWRGGIKYLLERGRALEPEEACHLDGWLVVAGEIMGPGITSAANWGRPSCGVLMVGGILRFGDMVYFFLGV